MQPSAGWPPGQVGGKFGQHSLLLHKVLSTVGLRKVNHHQLIFKHKSVLFCFPNTDPSTLKTHDHGSNCIYGAKAPSTQRAGGFRVACCGGDRSSTREARTQNLWVGLCNSINLWRRRI